MATIIRTVQLEERLNDEDMADDVGVTAQTIGNARNEKNDLSALTIAAIGHVYGEHYIQPYADLMGGMMMPKSARDTDPVPALGTAIAKLSVIRGGKDRLDAVPAATAARDALNHFIASAA